MRDGELASDRGMDVAETPGASERRARRLADAFALRGARICTLTGALDDDALATLTRIGFDSYLMGADVVGGSGPLLLGSISAEMLRTPVERLRRHGLHTLVDMDLHRVGPECAVARERPHWFRGILPSEFPLDPRRAPHPAEFSPRFDHTEAIEGLTEHYIRLLCDLAVAGAAGFALHWPQRVPASVLQRIFRGVRQVHPGVRFTAWAPGLSRDEREALRDAGFHASFCSLPWWDYRAPWFVQELDQLRRIGDVIAPVDWPAAAHDEQSARAFRRSLAFAGEAGDAWLCRCTAENVALPESFAPFGAAVAALNREVAAHGVAPRRARCVSAPWAPVGAWLGRSPVGQRLTLVNSDVDFHAQLTASTFEREAGVALGLDALTLAPGEVRQIALHPVPPTPLRVGERELKAAMSAPRVAIEHVTPAADDGRFPIKRTLGETLCVEADVFADGHPTLCVRLLWRAAEADEWNVERMRALGNDSWGADFPLRHLGCIQYTIEAGLDDFGGLRSDVQKKAAAGQDVALEIEEARQLIERTARRAPEALREKLRSVAKELAAAEDKAARLLAPDVSELMAHAATPAFLARAAKIYGVTVERRAARFASWYELFPRSQGKPGRHGTFHDVIAQLPRIAAMGFDVLYFTPIHPIGTTHRKGKNNSLHAEPGEPGSPYAIGAKAGGHDAVHPELGTLDDFRALIAAAREHGLEIALDFAVQCSPDHPWIKEHPEWFAWRPDGSLRYAENPPKKYEDIVNVDFYAKGAKPALWTALRDVLAFWMRQGVKTFRVDNPHTKPLPFWEWVIADLRAKDPDVIFLSEAFTRPKLMYRLAKLGFSQSYTYFTWRNTRSELTEYLTELNDEPVRDFFRPHFFVNTPDINPTFLHHSGRAGFLIRAALATTLSGLWGMYSGFELCEAAPLDGKEEYLDSEKYELRHRDWNSPGSIAAEIAQLNRLRRENPALQSYLGIRFHNCSNDRILYYAKSTPSRDNVLLIAVNLDPHRAHDARIELPLWEWGMDDNGMLLAEDLVDDHAFEWRGKTQSIHLDPAKPYRIWRVRPERER